MLRRSPRSTPTVPLFPYTPLVLSPRLPGPFSGAHGAFQTLARGTEAHEPGRHCRGPVPKGQTGSGRHGPLDSRRFLINSGSKEELRSAKQTGRGMMLKLMTLVKASPTFDHAGFRDYWEIGRASCRERVCQYV